MKEEIERVGDLLLFERRVFIRWYNSMTNGTQVTKRAISAKMASRDQAIVVICMGDMTRLDSIGVCGGSGICAVSGRGGFV
jgi:hypothetical protein